MGAVALQTCCTHVHHRCVWRSPRDDAGHALCRQQSVTDQPLLRATQNTSELVREALAHVREKHPHWDRRGGADHVMVFSFDHARCDMAAGLAPGELGQMFSIQSYGDLTST